MRPIAALNELDDNVPGAERVKILGERLVLSRGAQGRRGLLGEQCPHCCESFACCMALADDIHCSCHGRGSGAQGKCLDQLVGNGRPVFRERVSIDNDPVHAVLLYGCYVGLAHEAAWAKAHIGAPHEKLAVIAFECGVTRRHPPAGRSEQFDEWSVGRPIGLPTMLAMDGCDGRRRSSMS